MKRGFSTVACLGYSYAQIADLAADAHLAFAEIRLGTDGTLCGLPEGSLSEVKKYFEEKRVKISNLGTSVALFGYEPEKIQKAISAICMARQVGAQGIRVFLSPFIKRFSVQSEFDYSGIVRALRELCVYGQSQGVDIWVESYNAFSTGAALKQLLADVSHPALKVIWDIMHSVEMGEAPEKTFALLKDSIVHVHLKDGRKNADPDWIPFEQTRLGEGELPIKEALTLLKTYGFAGNLSLEWENAWHKELQTLYPGIPELLQAYNAYLDRMEV